MAISTKTIKTRLRSIGNTKKITKAMELVAAAKMRKTVGAVLASRPYSLAAWEAVGRMFSTAEPSLHPLLQPHEQLKKACVIVISSNRGLCGGFNTNILNRALQTEKELQTKSTGMEIEWIVVGKKVAQALARLKKNVVAEFEKPDVATDATAITAIVKLVRERFEIQTYDWVGVIYTDYVSALQQKPRLKQLLPIERQSDSQLGSVASAPAPVTHASSIEYLFEPSPETVLQLFLPRLLTIQLYQALLESNASEHSARMLAMRNATDAAGDMMFDLTLAYNQARQAGITREIAEIAGGKAALE